MKHATFEQAVDDCARPKTAQPVVEYRRAGDDTIYAFRCRECLSCWKVYQNQYHAATCSWAK